MEETQTKSPKEIGKLVSQYFKSNHIPNKEIARRLGYSCPQVITNQLGGKTFSLKIASKYAKEFGFNKEFLMTGKGNMIDNPGAIFGNEIKRDYNAILNENNAFKQQISDMKLIIQSQQRTIEMLAHK